MENKHVHYPKRRGHDYSSGYGVEFPICRCGAEFRRQWIMPRQRITWADLTPEQAADIISKRPDYMAD